MEGQLFTWVGSAGLTEGLEDTEILVHTGVLELIQSRDDYLIFSTTHFTEVSRKKTK